MTDKDLKNKAISIKGKKYVLVADRVVYFNEAYPDGSIETQIISPIDSERIIVKATVTPDMKSSCRRFTGYSQAVIGQGMINETAALENAETSAVGRALAFMGIGVIESIASVDEMNKAGGFSSRYAKTAQSVANTVSAGGTLKCSKCGEAIDARVASFSQSKYGKPLCRKCQPVMTTTGATATTEENVRKVFNV